MPALQLIPMRTDRTLNTRELHEAREWINDCEANASKGRSDREIEAAVARCYDGGVGAFQYDSAISNPQR